MTADEVRDRETTHLIIDDRTYTRRGSGAEVEFLKSHRNIKSVPVGEPRPF